MHKKTIYLLLLPVLMLFLAACQADPRRDAEAYATRIEAEQYALNQEQARQQAEELHRIEVLREQTIQQIRADVAGHWAAAKKGMITVLGFSVSVVLVGLAAALTIGSIGVGAASVRAANVRANLIPLDHVTRQYPVYLQHVHGSKWALVNPNIDSVRMLDADNPADRQLIATSGATQIAGVMASEAARSQDPAGVAMVNPPIVHAQAQDITLGAGYWENHISIPGKEKPDEVQN